MGKCWNHTPETIEVIRQAAIKQHAENRGNPSGLNRPESVKKRVITRSKNPKWQEYIRTGRNLQNITPEQRAYGVKRFTEEQHILETGTNASKLTRIQAWAIRHYYSIYMSNKEISEIFGITERAIRNIITYRSWKFIKDDDYTLNDYLK